MPGIDAEVPAGTAEEAARVIIRTHAPGRPYVPTPPHEASEPNSG